MAKLINFVVNMVINVRHRQLIVVEVGAKVELLLRSPCSSLLWQRLHVFLHFLPIKYRLVVH